MISVAYKMTNKLIFMKNFHINGYKFEYILKYFTFSIEYEDEGVHTWVIKEF